MKDELMIGIELLFSGVLTVFAVLFLFKIIMDLMSVIAAKYQHKEKQPVLTELELAAIVAVIKHRRPCSHGAKINLMPIEEEVRKAVRV